MEDVGKINEHDAIPLLLSTGHVQGNSSDVPRSTALDKVMIDRQFVDLETHVGDGGRDMHGSR